MFTQKFEKIKNLSEMFELVKESVRYCLNKERAGLMLGLAELGGSPENFVGAFYQIGGNVIVMNKTALNNVKSIRPDLYNSYCFFILLHEYLHSLGILDESYTQSIEYMIIEKVFGTDHTVTQIARNFNSIFPNIMMVSQGWQPDYEFKLEIISGFNSSNASYIG